MKTSIRVQMTVEVCLSEVWSDGCTMGQMKSQAKEEGLHMVNKALNASSVNVIGEQTVSVHVTDI